MTMRKILYFTAPKQVEVREERLPVLGDDEALVETLYSAISAGTEMLVYRGQFSQMTDEQDEISSALQYPLTYGYSCVGRVVETGKTVDKSWKGKNVFSFQPHSSFFIAQASSLLPLPHEILPEAACFLPNMETAVNLVQDGAPILGERVLVLGQGVVGLLTAALLSEFPLSALSTHDLYPLRQKALGLPVEKLDGGGNAQSGYANELFDLVFELSGAPAALDDAIALTKFSGRIVIGSWYGQKRAPLDLGGRFHRSRIKLIASQVSSIAPELSARWSKTRRFEVAWRALARIKPERWITRRFPLADAAKAYQLLDERPEETIQVIFEHKS
ncbi:MAG: zinc-binding alcohol dehydrogenase [Anaerolineales bacterium]